jgi:hypothetical protein
LEADLAAFDKYALSIPVHKLKCVAAAHKMTKFFNDRLPPHKHTVPYCGIMGCLDTYSLLRGAEFFLDFYDQSQAVHKIFSHYTERAIEWIRFACQTWGAPDLPHNLHDKIDMGEDYCAYMPPDLFQEFVIPYTGKIMHAAGKGKLKSLKFVLCTGGAIGANAKPENIDASLDAVYEVTKY